MERGVEQRIFLVLILVLHFLPTSCKAHAHSEPVEFVEDEEETLSLEGLNKEELADLADNPLDLNASSVEELLKLPMVDYRLARKIITYRKRKQFTMIEELRNVEGMTDEILANIRPYIKVEKTNVSLTGSLRLRMKMEKPDTESYFSADPDFQNPPYLYGRAKILYGHRYQGGFVFRHGGPQSDSGSEPKINFSNIWRYYLIKYWFTIRDFYFLDKVVIGDYRLQYGQGLIFYYPLGTELVRPVKIEPKGIAEDSGTAPNIYFRGIAVEKKLRRVSLHLFYSRKKLDALLNPDGTVGQTLISIRDNMGYITSEKEKKMSDSLEEELMGGRVAWSPGEAWQIGCQGYQSAYNPEINPPLEKGYFVFRGKRNRVIGCDFDGWWENLNLCGEYAQSIGYGNAWLVQPMLKLDEFTIWTLIYGYDPDYYNEHSSGPTIVGRRDQDWNEKGMLVGAKYKNARRELQIYFRPTIHPWKNNSLMPAVDREFWFDIQERINKRLEIYLRHWRHYYQRESTNHDFFHSWQKTRFQVTYYPDAGLTYRIRWEGRTNRVHELHQADTGYLVFTDLRWQLRQDFKVEVRSILFQAEPGVAMSETEFIWPMSIIPYHWWTYGKGIRYYLAVTHSISKNMEIWMKYENTCYYDDCGINKPQNAHEMGKVMRSRRHGLSVQLDVKW